MSPLERWPFPPDPIPRSWAAASKVTVAAVGIFSTVLAGSWSSFGNSHLRLIQVFKFSTLWATDTNV